MFRIYFILILISILPLNVDAQDNRMIDSLNVAIQKSHHDSTKVRLIIELAEYTYLANPDTTILICQDALKIANAANLLLQKAECLGWLGYLAEQQGYPEKGLEYNLKALSIQEEVLLNKGEAGKPALTPQEQKNLNNALATTINNIGFIYERRGKIDKALELYRRSIHIYEEVGDSSGVARTLNNMGSLFLERGETNKGLEYYRKSLILQEAIKNDQGVATLLNNIAELYDKQGDVGTGLKYLHRSLKILEKLNDKRSIALLLNNLAYIYKSQDDISRSLEYYHKSMNISEGIGNKEGKALSLNNIGSIYKAQGEMIKALEYYTRSLNVYKEIGYIKGVAATLNNIGGIYELDGQLNKALKNFKESVKLADQAGDKKGVATSLNSTARILLKQGELEEAKSIGYKGIELAKQLGFPEDIRNSAQLLTGLHKDEGAFEKSLLMYELFIQMRDSIKNEETQKATIRQQTKYEFEKAQLHKEQEEKDLARIEAEVTSRRDNLQYSVILISILILFGGVLALGFINVSQKMAEGIIFFSFLILFEFILVLADPYIDRWSGGAPGIKLLFNAGIAAFIFPLHSFFEARLKGHLVKS